MNKQWITDSEDSAFELLNVKISNGDKPFRIKVPALTDKELATITENDVPEKDARLAYYRMQVILYADITYDDKHYSKYSPTKAERYKELIKANNELIELPYHYGFDDQNIPLSDTMVELYAPDTWLTVIPGAAIEVLYMLDKDERDKVLHQLIYNYMIRTLPIYIKTVD